MLYRESPFVSIYKGYLGFSDTPYSGTLFTLCASCATLTIVSKAKKSWVYANPIVHAVRKRTTVLAAQLEGKRSLEHLSKLYLQVVVPESFDDDGALRILNFDVDMGVLTFQPEEKPLELVIGDWLVYDGHDLVVVSNSHFTTQYGVSRVRNRRKNVREKRVNRFEQIRKGNVDEYDFWNEW